MKPDLLVVFDLDGTLADVRHRMHYIRPEPPVDPATGKKVRRRFDFFHAACSEDAVIEPVANLYRSFVSNPSVVTVVLSGRDAVVYNKTVLWFQENKLPLPDELILKTGDQHTPDVEQKRVHADRLEAKYGRPIDMVFEDRDRVVALWKERGTFVLNVEQ